MDASKFGRQKTGQLIQIAVPEQDWSFLPNPLPPSWPFPNELWPLLAEAKERLGTLNGIGRTLPDLELLLKPSQRREAIRSSSLEGTYASPEELLLFELNPKQPESEHDRANEWLEVMNYGTALTHGAKLIQSLPLSLRLIREMHGLLLHGVRGRDKSPGEFRKYQVHIGSDRRYIPPPATHVPACLNALERYLNSDDKQYDPLVRCYIVHYQFEAIHPFVDGNGRVGRALLALMIYKWCNHFMPWLYMSPFYEKHKDEYIDNLFQVSTAGDWTRWIEFCLRGTISQAEDSIRRCDLLVRLRAEFHERITGGSKRTHRIMERLFGSPMVTVPAVAKDEDVSYPTAKTDIDYLLKVGILAELRNRHPRTYYSPEILKIAYEDDGR